MNLEQLAIYLKVDRMNMRVFNSTWELWLRICKEIGVRTTIQEVSGNLVLATGRGNLQVVQIWTAETVRFGP